MTKNGGPQPLSCLPVTDGFFPSPTKEDEGRLFRIEYSTFVTLVVYTPNSGSELDRLKYRIETWDPSYRKMILKEKKPVIAIGDFNVAHLDEDIWNLNISQHVPKSAGTTPEERESFGKLLTECNLIDTFARYLEHMNPSDKTHLGISRTGPSAPATSQ